MILPRALIGKSSIGVRQCRRQGEAAGTGVPDFRRYADRAAEGV